MTERIHTLTKPILQHYWLTPLFNSLDILTILFDTAYLIFIATTTHNENNKHNHNNQHFTNINLNNSNLTKNN